MRRMNELWSICWFPVPVIALVLRIVPVVLIVPILLTGCGTSSDDAFWVQKSEPTGTGASAAQPAQPATTATPSAPASPPSESPRRPVAMPPGIASPEDVMQAPPSPPPAVPQAAPAQPAVVSVPAQVGVGQKGSTLTQPGFLTTPVSVFFRSREMVAFRIQVPHAMQLFKATNGRAPQSHDEFMREIIQANGIQLPQLPPGHRYVYDPAREELMVEQPNP